MTTPAGSSETHQALARGEWRTVLDLLADPDGPDASGDDIDPAERLEMRAQAAYGVGEFEVSITFALPGGHVVLYTGLMAAVRGWLRRAESLLVDLEECGAHAVIAMVRTYERFMCGDMEAARREAHRSIELGERLGMVPATGVITR